MQRSTAVSSSRSRIVGALAALLFFAISIVVARRDHSVGADTYNYATYFHTLYWLEGGGRYEWLFTAFTTVLRSLTETVEVFFFLIALTVCFAYRGFYLRISAGARTGLVGLDEFLLAGVLLGSSWFLVAVTNGLRQGMSLPFLYLSLACLQSRKWIQSAIFFGISAGFHSSAFLVLPFLAALFLKRTQLLALLASSAIMYMAGISERVVQAVSRLLHSSFYQTLKSYGQESGNWAGFQLDLFIYSIFWPVLFYFAVGLIRESQREIYLRNVDLYTVLLLPYLWFGFGGYSNRYGMIAWFLLPALIAFAISVSRLSVAGKLGVASVITLYGIVFFSRQFI